jgi:hypothetical protein
MIDHIAIIRSTIDSIPFTAPEAMGPKVEQLMEATLGLIGSLGWKVCKVDVRPKEPEGE